jgi:putative aminopeptidase FrvX
VPGANDNLTGCAGGVLLLERLTDDKPDDVELVLVATGSEEAGTGGAFRLAQAMSGVWSKDDTVIVAIDGLSNGEMRYMEDGEIVRLRIPEWLEAAAADAAASDPRFAQVKPFQIPVGGSDAAPFEAMGWPGIALVCIDPDIGAPRHYHHPSDTPANLDMDQFVLSVDYIEAVVRRIWTV